VYIGLQLCLPDISSFHKAMPLLFVDGFPGAVVLSDHQALHAETPAIRPSHSCQGEEVFP
jgi:hypothetical protein